MVFLARNIGGFYLLCNNVLGMGLTFWLIIDEKIANIMKTIADYTDEDIEIYNELINRINELNPL
jgi:hypothetical protein